MGEGLVDLWGLVLAQPLLAFGQIIAGRLAHRREGQALALQAVDGGFAAGQGGAELLAVEEGHVTFS